MGIAPGPDFKKYLSRALKLTSNVQGLPVHTGHVHLPSLATAPAVWRLPQRKVKLEVRVPSGLPWGPVWSLGPPGGCQLQPRPTLPSP